MLDQELKTLCLPEVIFRFAIRQLTDRAVKPKDGPPQRNEEKKQAQAKYI